MSDYRGNKDNKNDGKPNSRLILMCVGVTVVLILFFSQITKNLQSALQQEVSYDVFLKAVEQNLVDRVYIKQEKIEFTKKGATDNPYESVTFYTGTLDDFNLIDKLYESGVTFQGEIVDTGTTIFDIILAYGLPFIIIYVLMYFFMRTITKSGGGGLMGVGKSNAKLYEVEKDTGVFFKDVAGQDEAKESIYELVDFLHNPGKYQRIGARLPKGALLVGPPGTGKTLLAKAVAGEAHVPFFSLAGSAFVEMFVGVGASRVRDLFKQAQSQAPCIVFIDEIDAIGKSRDSQYGGGNDEREQTLNQLLAEMDGFDTSKGIVILAATNRPEVLDKALLRPGRFDRRIIVEKPDLKGRVEVLKVHAAHVNLDDSVNLEEIGLATSGAVGSDLANIINEAAILAVKNGRNAVCQADLMESVEVVIAGKEKKDRVLSPEEKKIVAYHETGHALITALEKKAEPVQKITIVPRTMGSLGYVMQVPEEEKYLQSADELRARLVTLYGGRAAEEVVFGSITTGAASDIEKATSIARAMVTQYGMSKKFGLIALESIEHRYLDGRPVMNCGQDTVSEIDHEVMELLEECHAKAVKLLEENRDVLDKIAAYLTEKETITGKQFMELYDQAVAARTVGSPDRVAEDAKPAEVVSDAGSAAVPESAVSDTAETTEKEVSEAPE
ncbi:MAG: ATP-dependent zinc metalloprotease FtsH [Lachnospiraceae bacterium]|nr:ATP-dependent zinc metalloprotease FtsH [Lachnospiraceae bacterium]